MPDVKPVGVIGAGAWGTALAQSMGLSGEDVVMWDRDVQVVQDINKLRENRKRYPGIVLSERVRAMHDLNQLAATCEVLIVAVPSDVNGIVAAQLASKLGPEHVVVIAAKGFRESDGALLADVWREAAPRVTQLAVLTGPTFAREMMEQRVTTFVVASADAEVRARVGDLFKVSFVRVYENADMVGAQVGGAVKNILAVAAGMLEGLDVGHNARAAMLSRGLVEMARYSKALGGRDDTVWGLAGMGDLLLTATSAMSRNYRFGQLIGKGIPLHEAKLRVGTVEGILAARIVTVQAQAHGLDLAIVSAIDGILHGDITPLKAIEYLMQRPRGMEFEAA